MILVLIPTKRNLDAEITYRSVCSEARLVATCGQHLRVIRDFSGPGDAGLDPKRERDGVGEVSLEMLRKRVAHTAPIRQAMVEKYLEPGDSHVLWIDADIVQYSNTILADLLSISSKDVVAPGVYLESDATWFYDIAGFVEEGHWASVRPPHFQQTGDVIELDGVGCFYLVPAEVYRRGAKHEPVEGLTDHYAVCRFAKQQGFRVLCAPKLKVQHADYRLYGKEARDGT